MLQKRFNEKKAMAFLSKYFSLGIAFIVVTIKVNEAEKSMKTSLPTLAVVTKVRIDGFSSFLLFILPSCAV